MPEPTATLPLLRQDLQLLEGGTVGGERAWLIYDPVRHRYFQIDVDAFAILGLWQPVTLEEFVTDAAVLLGRDVKPAEIEELVQFLFVNNLTDQPIGGDALAYARPLQKHRNSVLKRLLHGYLFFRLPLARPARFLQATMPLAAPLYTWTAFTLVLITTVVGLYLASRQWDVFTATFLDLFSLEGAVLFAVSLAVIKVIHELGHAYTATRWGVRVNTMGIAFMLMMPILYTDVTDAWRLRSRAARLQIAAAGMTVELALAGIATFLWAFLPDGPARSVAFMIATTSWILSLAVNLNPFMRFDGYYLLADAWRMENLQARAFALARWWLRETLFGLGHAPPEDLPKRKRRLVILYGLGVWIYRLVLFLGIALLVYHMFFKVLGVVLFAIEIIWLILMPVFKEIAEWIKMRKEISRAPRAAVTAGIVVVMLTLFFLPWSGTVRVPAVALAGQEYALYPPRPARLVSLNLASGDDIAAGARLAVLHSPDLEHEITKTRLNIALFEARMARIPGDASDRGQREVILQTLVAERAKLQGFMKEKERMVIRAPFPGRLRDQQHALRPGEWVNEERPLARLVRNPGREAEGYVHEDDLWKLARGQSALFVPEDPLLAKRRGRLTEVAAAGSRTIDIAYLASVYGGAVPADRDEDGELRPRSGRYRIRVDLEGAPLDRAVRGTLHLEGRPESLAAAFWRRLLQVLVRESGI